MFHTLRTRPSRSWRISALVAGAFCLASVASAVPALQFASPNVVVSQVTPGGDVAILTVCHEPDGDVVRRDVQTAQVTDTDADGSVTFNTNGSLTSKAIWAACDVATGQVTIGAPNHGQPTQVIVDPVDFPASASVIDDERQSLHLLLCRPGGPAFAGESFDGAPTDAGTADDGWVRLELKDLVRVDGNQGTFGTRTVLNSGDVVVGMDPEFLTYYVTTIP